MTIENWMSIDRKLLYWFNGSNSQVLDGVAMTLTSGLTWLPLYMVLFYLVVKNNETMRQITLVMASVAFCLFLSDGMADGVVKPLVARFRPCNDPIWRYTFDVVGNYRPDGFSFFSAHASNTMSLAIFFCLLVRSRMLSYFLIGWSLINCWTRLYLGAHYPFDILVGLLWGSISGSLAYYAYLRTYQKISPDSTYVSTQYTPSGYDFTGIDMVVTTIVLTCMYALIKSLIV